MDIESIEIDLLLEAIHRRYGHDFRSYARTSLARRLRQAVSDTGCACVSDLIPRVLHDAAFFTQLTRYFSIPFSALFRDPQVYRALRERVVPMLRTWPHIKVWHAGCATGEEVYSLAIVLKETGLYDRTTLYATDFNDQALARAREGIYPIERLRQASHNYLQAGGSASLSDYYHAAYDAVIMDAALRERVLFANHNLAMDSAFGEMHLVLCRNVLIYFDPELRARALTLFDESLVHGGFLCLGSQEDLERSRVRAGFEVVDHAARLYRKRLFA